MVDIEAAPAPESERRGRRGGRGGAHRPDGIQQPPWRQPRLTYQPVRAVSDDELEAIHEASLQVLEEIGMDFLEEEAREILRAAGAEVEPGGMRVRIDRGLIEASLGKAPPSSPCTRAIPSATSAWARAGSPTARSRARPTAPIWTAAAGAATTPITAPSSSSATS